MTPRFADLEDVVEGRKLGVEVADGHIIKCPATGKIKIEMIDDDGNPIELVEILPRIMAKLDYTATRLERVEKQLAELTDANKDALVKPSEATHHTPSPLRKNRRISHTNVSSLEGAGSTEAEQAAEQAAEQE